MARPGSRLKETIIRGGENIYPREIEDVISEYPGVGECAVFGVTHPRWGEEVAVALRLLQPHVAPDLVKRFLQDRLARHKIPKHWTVIDDFPRNALGKTQKLNCSECLRRNSLLRRANDFQMRPLRNACVDIASGDCTENRDAYIVRTLGKSVPCTHLANPLAGLFTPLLQEDAGAAGED